MQNLGIIDQKGIFEDCRAWNHIYAVFGINLIMLLMTFRIMRLFYILKGKPTNGTIFWLPLMSTYIPILLFVLVSYCMSNKSIYAYPLVTGTVACPLQSQPALVIGIGIGIIQISIIWFLTLLVSKIRMNFQDFKQDVLTNMVFLFAIVLQVILIACGQSNTPAGKIIIVFNSVAVGTSLWAVPLYGPVFGLLFDKHGYLKRWRAGLRSRKLPSELINFGITSNSEIPSVPKRQNTVTASQVQELANPQIEKQDTFDLSFFTKEVKTNNFITADQITNLLQMLKMEAENKPINEENIELNLEDDDSKYILVSDLEIVDSLVNMQSLYESKIIEEIEEEEIIVTKSEITKSNTFSKEERYAKKQNLDALIARKKEIDELIALMEKNKK